MFAEFNRTKVTLIDIDRQVKLIYGKACKNRDQDK